MFRNIITLLEDAEARTPVWHGASREDAKTLIHHLAMSDGDLGHGFYAVQSPAMAEDEDEERVVLEYRVKEDVRVLDLDDDADLHLWHRYQPHLRNPKLWKLLYEVGIDGVMNETTMCFYNTDALQFERVYSGVIDDPLEETDTNLLDEVALGGLARCTAVTINALLADFHLRPIILRDVPVDNPGVLRVLNMKGLSYKPYPFDAGRTVQQFVGAHKMYDWYLLTPGHAMALVRGELFDAENKGPDGRKLQAVFQISRR